jgi:hypothetical protein
VRALYDCGRYLTSFNFFEWLLQAEARGATKVVFDIRNLRSNKWPLEYAARRFWSICAPGPALIGLPHEVFRMGMIGETRARDVAKPGGAPIVAFWKSGNRFKRLKSVRTAGKARYTVTLRKTQRSPLRDSDRGVWLPFAEEIGAVVIPDYDEKPMHLHERMALYAGAEMNFFVSNGPGVLCSFTEYPCMLFNTVHARGSLLADGLEDGVQYPWMLENQRAIWEEATAESLRRHFYHWRETGRFAEDGYSPTPAT